MASITDIYMKNNFPGVNYYIDRKENGSQDIFNYDTKDLITNTFDVLDSEVEINTMEFAEIDAFVEELFNSEPLWEAAMLYARSDMEMAFLFNITVTLLISPGDRDGSALKKCWDQMLIRLGTLVGGRLATDEDAVRWNERIDRLYMPIWLKLETS